MRPIPYKVDPLRTIWLDYKTGKGVRSDGLPVQAIIKTRRKTPTLDDLLDVAGMHNGQWIVLTGSIPKQEESTTDGAKNHWLRAETPGWIHGDHQISANATTGVYFSQITGNRVYLSFAKAWFGDAPLSPVQALTAWSALTNFLHKEEKKMLTPMMSPAATGAELWAHSVNDSFNPEPLDDYIAEQIHATSGQHHIEHLVAGPYAAKHPDCVPLVDPKMTPAMDTFAHSDGRFMYAALCSELGVGPAVELNQEAAADLWLHSGRQGKYAKARYRVKFKVPDTWDHVGILGVQSHEDRSSWYYPNRPGARGETWADHRELIVAENNGWLIEPLEGVRFTEKMRPMETFADRIKRARKSVEESGADPVLVKAVTAAFRNILLHGIGRFASRGEEQLKTAATFDGVPEAVRHSARELPDGRWTYLQRAEMNPRRKGFYHPEISAQIWGWARARVLESPAANGHKAGALTVNPRTLLGIEGDAIYTTETPAWALPVAHGGGDDGEVGRIRLQGYLTGDMKVPTTLMQRDALKKKADAAGPSAAWEA